MFFLQAITAVITVVTQSSKLNTVITVASPMNNSSHEESSSV